MGRQPYIVYGLLKTEAAFSPSVSAGKIWTSLVLFGVIYALLFALFIYLLNDKIQAGPEKFEEQEPLMEGHRA